MAAMARDSGVIHDPRAMLKVAGGVVEADVNCLVGTRGQNSEIVNTEGTLPLETGCGRVA